MKEAKQGNESGTSRTVVERMKRLLLQPKAYVQFPKGLAGDLHWAAAGRLHFEFRKCDAILIVYDYCAAIQELKLQQAHVAHVGRDSRWHRALERRIEDLSGRRMREEER